ncbi:MAG: Ig-like domain-containing protein [Lachnospiraceae bacterium]|nr:Ig-like domain-containing protein [Lachnospiraceae bacterium]
MSYEIRKKVCSAILTFVLIVSLFPVNAFATGGTMEGTGTASDPYQIADYADLCAFATKVNSGETGACAILVNKIYATGQTNWSPIGNDSHKYSGTFDGNGKVIYALYYNHENVDYVGLFGYVDGGEVRNVAMENGSITGGSYTGAVAGHLESGTIANCYNIGAINGGQYVGGLVGYLRRGTVVNCINIGSVSGDDLTGGLVGQNRYGAVRNSYNTGAVCGDGSYVGGLVGYTNGSDPDNGIINNCYNTGEVSGSSYIGGLVGYTLGDAIVQNCYNTGEVSGSSNIGGLVGYNWGGTIVQNCYNLGNVSGNSPVGGLIGHNGLEGTAKDLYYDTDLVSCSVALYDNDGTATNVTGKTTAEMTGLDCTAYDNWEDFDTYWYLTESYPVLKNNHTHNIVHVSARSATCTSDGNTEYWRCTVGCEGYSDATRNTEIARNSWVIPATGHSYGAWTKLDNTKHRRVCANDSSHVETENHNWNAGVVTKQATVNATGVKTYTCVDCHATKTEAIPKLPKSTETESETQNTETREPETETETNKDTNKVSVKNEPVIASAASKGKKSLTFGWTKVDGAEGYDIFFTTCNHDGKKCACKNVKSIKGNKTLVWTKSGLKKGTSYKVCFKAYVIKNGKKKYIKTSPLLHAYTNGGNDTYTNAKSVKVSKSKVTLKKGKTFTIKAKVEKLDKKKKLMPSSHVATLRYYSSDKSIATVDSKGKVKAKSKGVCYIDVIAHNGVSDQVKVTVK